MNVDILTGATPPPYTLELVNRLPPSIDRRLIRSRAYAPSRAGTGYRLVHHPLSVRRARRDGALLHVDTQLLAYVLGIGQRRPTILSCHDLVQFMKEFDDPSYVSRRRALDRAQLRLVRKGILAASRVIAVSKHTQGELVRFGLPAGRIDVVPWGVDSARFRPMDRARCRDLVAKYRLPTSRPLVVHVGAEHPRKNLPGFLRAFARARTNALFATVGLPRQPQRRELERLVRELGLADRVVFVDCVSDEDLPVWYNAADAFVLPSLHEGFGIPPLEAMACGTPVAVSNVTSLPEVVGDAALLFDPRDETDIVRGIESILQDSGLRDRLRARGRARASEFPWDRTVDGVVRAYGRASSDH